MDTNNVSAILYMQIRLLDLAHDKCQKSENDCKRIFADYHIYDYIADSFEFFQTQSDDENIKDIASYINKKKSTFIRQQYFLF